MEPAKVPAETHFCVDNGLQYGRTLLRNRKLRKGRHKYLHLGLPYSHRHWEYCLDPCLRLITKIDIFCKWLEVPFQTPNLLLISILNSVYHQHPRLQRSTRSRWWGAWQLDLGGWQDLVNNYRYVAQRRRYQDEFLTWIKDTWRLLD